MNEEIDISGSTRLVTNFLPASMAVAVLTILPLDHQGQNFTSEVTEDAPIIFPGENEYSNSSFKEIFPADEVDPNAVILNFAQKIVSQQEDMPEEYLKDIDDNFLDLI